MMAENLSEALSLDQAVEKMMGHAPEADDEATDVVEVEGTDVGEPETEETEVVVEAENEGEPEPEPEFEIETVDGVKKLTLSQLKEGAMLKADYTRKTMALAEDRKAVDREKSETAHLKEQLAEALQQWAVPVEQEPNWTELAQKLDPQKYQTLRAQWDDRQRQAARAREAFHAMQKANRDKVIAEEQSKLLDAVPEWRDQTKFESAAREIVTIASNYGFSPEELVAATDHRVFLVLRDAAAYRKLKEAKPEVTKRVSLAAPSLKPGAKPVRTEAAEEARQKQLATFKKSGSIEDAVELLFRR